MNTDIFTRRATPLAFAAAGLLMASTPVLAQSEITITAPRTVQQQVGRTASGIPIDQLSLTRKVSYADLDLTNPGDQARLDQRISDAARIACADLDRKYPDALYPAMQSSQSCYGAAIEGAKAQVSLAVATQPRYTPPPAYAPQASYVPSVPAAYPVATYTPPPQPLYIEHTGPHASGDYMAEQLNRQELQAVTGQPSGPVMSGSSD